MASEVRSTSRLGVAIEHQPGPIVLVLGSLAVEGGGRTLHVAGAQRRRLLALLASRPGRTASVEAIVDALWVDDPPPSASKTVQSHVVRLRRSLAALGDVIETVAGGYRLALPDDAVDASRFEGFCAAGHEHLRAGDHRVAAERFSAALELWRGTAYLEFRDIDFGAAEGVRLDELRLVTLEDLAEMQLTMGAAAGAVPGLERLVRDEPGRERAWSLLMRALYASGRQHDALGAFQRARHRLAEEFGLAPGPGLRAVERQILDQSPAFDTASGRGALAAALRASTPFVGRSSERAALDVAWRMAGEGSGQLRILSGPLDVGRTRLAADLAGRVLGAGGDVEYVRAADGLTRLDPRSRAQRPEASGSFVDAIAERCRRAPLLLVVDDVEWAAQPTVAGITSLAAALDDLPVLLLLIVDPSGGGPSVAALERLDPGRASTLSLGPLPDDDIAVVVVAEGVDADAVPVVAAVAGGLPGVARREAAGWAERTASDRLRAAASSSSGALAVANQAHVSVLDEVVDLVAARARRDELHSAKWAGRQPYRALASYEAQDAEVFVGRERVVAELAAKVLERRLVIVVGPSGGGKSSIVRAGLLPLARSGRLPGDRPWRDHLIVPGRDPMAALGALDEPDEHGPRLLVVDQFEELFAAASATVDAFAAALIDLASDPALDVHVVIVVRADEYGALTAIPGLIDAVGRGQLVVGPPSEDEVRRIVDEPARRTGLSVEPALIDLVASDVGGHDAALPLVSAAMAELWERRDGTVLLVDRYVEMGGIATAVERIGEQAVRRSSPSELAAIREVLLLLADVTDGGQFTRRRARIDDIPARLIPAVDTLVDARLVVRGEATVEVVHEVVLRAWPRLAAWLAEARDDLVRGRELVIASRTWDAEGRSDDNVHRGERLMAAADWMTRRGHEAPPVVAAFIEAGQQRAHRERVAADTRTRQQVRANRRLRGLLTGTAVLLVAALVAGFLAVRQADRADTQATMARREAARADSEAVTAVREADRADDEAATAMRQAERADSEAEVARAATEQAEATALLADAERLGALAGLEGNLDRALLLAAQAASMADTASTRGALLRAVERSPAAVGIIRSERARLLRLELSPNGTTLAVKDNEGTTTFYDAATGRSRGSFRGTHLDGLVWTPDGTAVVTLDLAPTHDQADPEGFAYDAVVVDAESMTERARYTGLTESASDLTFSPDGQLLVASPASNDRGHVPVVTVWETARPGPPARTIELPEGLLLDEDEVSFDAAGDRVAVSAAGATVLISPRSGEIGDSYDGAGGVFSPDGRWLAVNPAGEVFPLTLELVDVPTGQRRALQGAHTERILDRSFSPDGTLLATTGNDRLVRLWDTATGQLLRTLSGHTGRVLASAFSPDGGMLYTTGLDRSVITWDLIGRASVERALAAADPAVTFSDHFAVASDGSAAATVPLETDVLSIVDVGSGVRRAPLPTGHGVLLDLLTGEANTMYTGGLDGVIRRWDMGSGTVLAESAPPGERVVPLALAPDGSKLWVQSFDGPVSALDPLTLEPTGGGFDVDLEIDAAAVSPDGSSLAISTFDPPAIQTVDVDTGVSRSLELPSPVFAMAYSPDGTSLVAGDNAGRLLRVDPAELALVDDPAPEHDGPVTNVRFAPDGTQFTSGSTDGTIVLWEAATGRPVGSLQPGSPNEQARAFWAPDGHTLLVMYEGGSVYAFDSRPASWLASACRTAGRQLSRAEWAELLPDRAYDPAC
ncbi:MAG: BTAD domain-containing putative transcriptional regulator [Ilumatobacteraceae bacterium]